MGESDSTKGELILLQEKLMHLERHIAAQDKEVYYLSSRVDSLQKKIEIQKLQIEALSQGGQPGGGSPADERPPHY